jgi:hypothetical protein
MPSPPGSQDTPLDAHGRTPSLPTPDSDIDDADNGLPGALGSRPRECWRYLKRDTGIDNAEASLRFSIVVQTRCGSSEVLLDDARMAIAMAARLQLEEVVMRHYYPENFIVLCGSQAVKDSILATSHCRWAAPHW